MDRQSTQENFIDLTGVALTEAFVLAIIAQS
jgi:hypothetical protein